jgi:hypothetical protein
MKIDPASALDRFVHELLAKMAFVLRRLDFDDRKQLTEQGAKSMRLVKELMTYGREYVSMTTAPAPSPSCARRPKPRSSGTRREQPRRVLSRTEALVPL